MTSKNNTLIGAGQSLTDQSGNVWSILNGQVAVNGRIDPTTANVTHLAYANGLVWQENTNNLWWSKASPSASWQPTYGTATAPVPITASANNTIVSAVNGTAATAIQDASGNTWSIANGKVVLNGTADPTTANVTHLAYVNGQVWQENASDLWWSKTTPASGWSPPYGTATVPLPVPASANDTVIGVTNGNSGVALTDASDNSWSIVSGRVTVNGAVDPTTANVVELAYVNGRIWQENTAGLWWSKAAPSDAWGPTYGTPTNPIQGTTFIIGNNGSHPATTIDIGEMTQSVSVTPGQTNHVSTTGVHVDRAAIAFAAVSGGSDLVITGNSSIDHGSLTAINAGVHTSITVVGASVRNDGIMTLDNGSFSAGSISGTGKIVATNGSTVLLNAPSFSDTIQLENSQLIISYPVAISFLDVSSVTMDAGSSVSIPRTGATFADYDPASGDMRLWKTFNNNLQEVAQLKFPGAAHVYAQATQGSGTLLTLTDSGHSLTPPPVPQ